MRLTHLAGMKTDSTAWIDWPRRSDRVETPARRRGGRVESQARFCKTVRPSLLYARALELFRFALRWRPSGLGVLPRLQRSSHHAPGAGGEAALLTGALVLPAAAQDADHARFRALLQEMVETNTSLSSGSCTALAEKIAGNLKQAGYPNSDIHLFAVPDHPKEGGIVAVLPGSDSQAKAILLLGHLDVVEARRADWTRDPYQFIEEGGFFYGRGVADMKAQVAAWVDTMMRLNEEGSVTKQTQVWLDCRKPDPRSSPEWLPRSPHRGVIKPMPSPPMVPARACRKHPRVIRDGLVYERNYTHVERAHVENHKPPHSPSEVGNGLPSRYPAGPFDGAIHGPNRHWPPAQFSARRHSDARAHRHRSSCPRTAAFGGL